MHEASRRPFAFGAVPLPEVRPKAPVPGMGPAIGSVVRSMLMYGLVVGQVARGVLRLVRVAWHVLMQVRIQW
eukprot:6581522-Pyramimonas_sp.AAC.1